MAFVAVLAFAAILTNIPPDSICANDIRGESPSPNKTHQAFFFSRDCGATTDYSIHVSVLPFGAHLDNEPGNVFIASSTVPNDSNSEIQVQWLSDNSLYIRHKALGNVVLNNKTVNGVEVTYEPSN